MAKKVKDEVKVNESEVITPIEEITETVATEAVETVIDNTEAVEPETVDAGNESEGVASPVLIPDNHEVIIISISEKLGPIDQEYTVSGNVANVIISKGLAKLK